MATPASANPQVSPTPPRMIPVVQVPPAEATSPEPASAEGESTRAQRAVTGWSPSAWRRGK